MRTQAGIGLNHGPGKGSKDRTTDNAAFVRNMEEVVFPGVTGVQKTQRGWRKVYGKPATKPD